MKNTYTFNQSPTTDLWEVWEHTTFDSGHGISPELICMCNDAVRAERVRDAMTLMEETKQKALALVGV